MPAAMAASVVPSPPHAMSTGGREYVRLSHWRVLRFAGSSEVRRRQSSYFVWARAGSWAFVSSRGCTRARNIMDLICDL